MEERLAVIKHGVILSLHFASNVRQQELVVIFFFFWCCCRRVGVQCLLHLSERSHQGVLIFTLSVSLCVLVESRGSPRA